jgi:hypothetical protein
VAKIRGGCGQGRPISSRREALMSKSVFNTIEEAQS